MRSGRWRVGVLALVLLVGCATGEQVETDERQRTLVFLSHSQWDGKIAAALEQRGFKIAAEPEGATAADVRYGLTVRFGRRVDYCVLNDSEKYSSVTYEVSDLQTKAVVATTRDAGWTGPCLVHWTEVFDVVADKLADTFLHSPRPPRD